MSETTIGLARETREALDDRRGDDQTYDDIVRELMGMEPREYGGERPIPYGPLDDE